MVRDTRAATLIPFFVFDIPEEPLKGLPMGHFPAEDKIY